MHVVLSALAVISFLPVIVAVIGQGRGGWIAICIPTCIVAPIALFLGWQSPAGLTLTACIWCVAWLSTYMSFGHKRAAKQHFEASVREQGVQFHQAKQQQQALDAAERSLITDGAASHDPNNDALQALADFIGKSGWKGQAAVVWPDPSYRLKVASAPEHLATINAMAEAHGGAGWYAGAILLPPSPESNFMRVAIDMRVVGYLGKTAADELLALMGEQFCQIACCGAWVDKGIVRLNPGRPMEISCLPVGK